MIETPKWTAEKLEAERLRAIAVFRNERLEEPLEAYLESFDAYQGVVEELLEATVDLVRIKENALDIVADPRLLEAFRYFAGPPISEDDLKTLSEAASLTPSRLRSDPEFVDRIVEVILTCLDRRRFAWAVEQREPSESERRAAVLASAALLATQRLSTMRRNEGKQEQEDHVETVFIGHGLTLVERRRVETLDHAPNPGEFCGESYLGTRKADFILRLWDSRIMPIECKVSNSATNSVKRLNNDAAVKAEVWRHDFGATQVVPVAVLGGVYNLKNLMEAQDRGLTLAWAHKLEDLLAWMEKTRNGGS